MVVFPTGARALQSSDPLNDFGVRNREWAALIERVADGDHEALTTLYEGTHRLLYGLLLRILANEASAEEVLFDTYMQVWRQAARYDRQRGNPLSWLVTMARSRGIDRLRADKQAERHSEPLNDLSPEAAVEDAENMVVNSEIRRLIRAALDSLLPEQREVIELAFYSGLTHREMAAHLNQPLGTVKTRVRRGMMKLREILGPVLEGMR